MIYSNWDDGHTRRVKAIVLGASVIFISLGVIWGTVFAVADRIVLSLFHVIMAILGAIFLFFARRGRLRIAAILEAHLIPLVIGVSCLFDTVPFGTQRATHLHFLSIAVGCYFVFRTRGVYLKFVIPAICLTAFIVFQNSSPLIHDPSLVIPQNEAWIGVLINTITSVAGLVMTVIIMNADLTVRHMIEMELRKAITNGDFKLYYQPQVNGAGQLVGAEALIRWRHHKMGNVAPSEFIPIAEETGLIVPIGNWALRTACAQLVQWQAQPETEHLTLSVNVSASQFRQPDFVRNVSDIINVSGANAKNLKLELTESMFVQDLEATIEKMNSLRATGIAWSLDDFGSGYSSLGVLHKFPLYQIKIDQSFIKDMMSNKSNFTIIEAVIALANKLNFQVIAEGVETADQLDRLREAGCFLFQGYFFSRPIDIDSFERYRIRQDLVAGGDRNAVARPERP